jgi:hypothetical protein
MAVAVNEEVAMPMDDRTKATVRALLDRYPRGYVQEETGFTVTKTAAGLFRLLCLSVLADDSAPSEKAVAATKALLQRRWDSAPEMAKSSEDERTQVLRQAGYPGAADASRRLGEVTNFVLERYDGDLENLRREEMLGWLAGALALVDARDEYDKVPAAT